MEIDWAMYEWLDFTEDMERMCRCSWFYAASYNPSNPLRALGPFPHEAMPWGMVICLQ